MGVVLQVNSFFPACLLCVTCRLCVFKLMFQNFQQKLKQDVLNYGLSRKCIMKIYKRLLSALPVRILAIFAVIATFGFITLNNFGPLPKGAPDNGGLVMPGGFEAVVVADSLGRARHLAVNTNGDIYVKLRNPDSLKRGSVAMRDT